MTEAVADWRGWKAVSALLVAAVAAYFVYFSLTRPAWDWDVVPYTLATLYDGAGDPAPAAARTWALVQGHVAPAEFAALISEGDYRRAVHADPQLLASQLPLYRSKLGYVLLLRALSAVLDPLQAMMAVSLAAALGTLALLYRQSLAVAGIATLAWFPIAKLFGLAASLATPDTLAAFVYLAGVVAWLGGRRGLAAALFVAGALVRLDGVVLNLVLALALARERMWPAVGLAVGSLMAFAVDIAVSGHLGWWTQFHFNFLQMRPDLRVPAPPFDPALYFLALRNEAGHLMHLEWVHAALAMLLLTTVLVARRGERSARLLLGALVAGATLRLLIYPSTEPRLYGPLLFGLGAVLLHTLRPPAAGRA